MYSNKSILNNIWEVKDFDERQTLMLSQRFNIPFIISKILNIRNINEDKIDQFLNPNLLDYLPNPFELKDMEKSVNRLIKALNGKEKIGIIADYDVDGATSAAILIKFLKKVSKKVILKIPNRLEQGYGPNEEILDELLSNKIDLLFTLDCGTSSFGIIDKKKYLKFDTIIIDHHISDLKLPNVFSIINPNRFDEKNDFKDLAAVGVTFLFILAIRKSLREKDYFIKNKIKEPNLLSYLDFVTLGTVCDVVNLQNYNRLFVSKGIEILRKRNNKNITTIIDNSNINHQLTTSDIGYIIGPQLNAASRVKDSSLASKFLITENIDEMESISRKLIIFNEKRKLIENNIYEQALEQAYKQQDNKIILVFGTDWHIGVIGIIASRLVEKFNKPVVAISFYDKINGTGSARSILNINIGKLIIEAKENGILNNGGGHKFAAGLKIYFDKLELFKEFLIEKMKDYDLTLFVKKIFYDSILLKDEINDELLINLEKLEPYGNGNPEPIFILENVYVEFLKLIKNKHVLIKLKIEQDKLFKGIAFNCSDNELGQYLMKNKTQKFNLCCIIKKDFYSNNLKPQIIIQDAMIVN